MNKFKFGLMTLLGATLWNTFLLWVGVKLGEHWEEITKYTRVFDIVIISLVALVAFYLVYKHGKHIKAHFQKRFGRSQHIKARRK